MSAAHADHGHDDYNFSGVRELPAPLPEGEHILWQGAPRWRSLFVRAFHGRKVAIYFALLIASRGVAVAAGGAGFAEALSSMAVLLPLAGAGLALLALIAWLSARASWYTVTSRRVLMRIGIVLEITFNFPYTVIESAGLRRHADGSGDLPIAFRDGQSIAWLHLWPHVRPGHFRQPQPMLRCVEQPEALATVLGQALAAATGGRAVAAEVLTTASVAAAAAPTPRNRLRTLASH